MTRMAFILGACLLVFVTACGGGGVTTGGPSSAAISQENPPPAPVPLRLSVSLTPQELASFQAALDSVAAAHPEWEIALELTPQQGVVEKISTQLAGNDLPDVLRVQGLIVQQWIRQGAFLELSSLIADRGVDLAAFYPGPLDQFRWRDGIYGLPDTAAPDVLFYNQEMFDAAGLAYPTDAWTFEDMRAAAIRLTLDEAGRHSGEPGFDPEAIVQWGWNGGLTFFWQRHLVRPFGGDFCANDDCTLMRFTDPATVAAAAWWADLTSRDHATLADPYGGSETGVPGDPFINGMAAMGYNGYFAVGQLNDAGTITYDVAQPLLGEDGRRYTPLSTNGYLIAADSEHPEAAWALIQVLTEADFLAQTWGRAGHSVPARRAAAASIIDPGRPPANQAAIVAAMEYGEVFKPYTASAFAVYGQTADLFARMMRGELAVAEGLAEVEDLANETLAGDR